MIFYLTGGDNSGKSTLANKIIRERKANYIHSDYKKDWDLKQYHTNIGNTALMLNSYGQDVVLDRWCLDAFPYRFVNKGNTYDPMELWNQFVKEAGNDLILVYCLSANEFDPTKREEMFNKEEMVVVEREFNKMFSEINHYKYFYKVDGSDMKGFINKCIESQKVNPLNYEWKEKIEFVNHGYDEEMKKFQEQEKEIEKEEKKGKHFKEQVSEIIDSAKGIIDEEAKAFNNYLKEYYKQMQRIDNCDKQPNEKDFDWKDLPKIIACDFDGTLVKSAFPEVSNISDKDINWNLVSKLKEEAKDGAKIVLWTNRTGILLDDAVKFSNEVLGLVFDAINDNIKEVKDAGFSPRKIYADIYYDDKGVRITF